MERLAAHDRKFGNPAAFISDIDKSNWMTFFQPSPPIRHSLSSWRKDRLEGRTGGAVTIVDSSWKIGFVLYGKYFPNQPANVNVFGRTASAAKRSAIS